ncbi:MAG: HD-GYP domain-containing protein [Caloramator sp.]|nr:HD-GYP domain-containing protein [Caloramator sp.]
MKVKVKDVVPGAILNDNVFTDNGLLLVQKGAVLNDNIIEKLREYNIEYIDIGISTKEEDLKRIGELYSHTVDKVKNRFEIIKLQNTVEISEFDDIVDELMDNINSNEILFYSKLLEGKNDYILEHSINVSLTAMLMGKWLSFNKDDIKILGICGILHDVGKVLIPDEILNKRTPLSPNEYVVMKNHTKYGYQLLKKSPLVDERVKAVALSHHERINGKGYPFGLSANSISIYSRIVAICDVYDEVTSKREYKPKKNLLSGLKVVFDDSYNGLDPFFSRVFLENAAFAYQGCKCLLSDGQVGRIIKIHSEKPERPWVALEHKFLNLEVNRYINVVDIF